MSRRHDSENEDDPEPFESSGDEWNVEDAKKEETSRRKSSRISRKPKRPLVEESASDLDGEGQSEEDDYFSEEEPVPKKKPQKKVTNTPKSAQKKQKVLNDSDLSNDTNSNMSQEDNKKDNAATDSDSSRTSTNVQSRGVHRKVIPKTIYSEDYATGSFVILKKDAQGSDPSKHPVIWRIDGKALLQKYEAFDEEETVRHKNTSIDNCLRVSNSNYFVVSCLHLVE
ncbi:uncharacterized protein LOC109538102 isoform X2 [Dendroctonus ponderosae]|uniref:uncharacterized protein LOC109538102 isoform X2 n=1 Tax=Dendroctonus ponderosae TaxID=77166 RepID=UPI002036598B|nr:uncharacterized protein LOC109538102 isoform X2 [Dendroctonus ponderosae]